MPIRYKAGYKYILAEPLVQQTRIRPAKKISLDGATLYRNGKLRLPKGWPWDGPSGLAIDTPTFMRASAVHDALYGFLRAGLLDGSRLVADQEMQSICRDAGMSTIRQLWTFNAVRLFAGYAAKKSAQRKVIGAP
jgi:hypothetical protein